VKWLWTIVLLAASCNWDCRGQCEKAGGSVVEVGCHDEPCIIGSMPISNGMSMPIYGVCRECGYECWMPNSDGVFKPEDRPR
jgi:hypothetical protein